MGETEELIWQLVREANSAWSGGRPLDVARLFHTDVVMASPKGEILVEGRDAMVQSFVDYCEQVTTHSFEELEHEVRVFGDTAVVSFAFAVDYEFEGKRHSERGRELLVFTREGARWAAVWRTQLPVESA